MVTTQLAKEAKLWSPWTTVYVLAFFAVAIKLIQQLSLWVINEEAVWLDMIFGIIAKDRRELGECIVR